ncbi:MAG: hypothetical protein QXV06_08000 [Ignisphaera sp.]
MDSDSGRICSRCLFFRPHIYFPYIGYCIVKHNSVLHEEPATCSSFKPSSIDGLKNIFKEQGWLYCVNCRKILINEIELEEHLKQHVVSSGVVLDEAIAEEAHAGD